jgi:hypothetical protein
MRKGEDENRGEGKISGIRNRDFKEICVMSLYWNSMNQNYYSS